MSGYRQYQITDLRTGDITYCWWPVRQLVHSTSGYVQDKPMGGENAVSRNIAGLKHIVEADVQVVPKGAEINLPFGDIPLVIRHPKA